MVDLSRGEETFVDVLPDSHFPIENLPYGIFSSVEDPSHRIGVAIGEYVVDLREIKRAGLFTGPILSDLKTSEVFQQTTLNDFMSLGPSAWAEARSCIQRLLSRRESILRDNQLLRNRSIIPQTHVNMHLPASIGDYTDFFCSLQHAQNCGLIFRGPENPLQPNWKHMPVGYHGRSSSIVVSGTDVRRPWGQTSNGKFQPSERVDFELEMGCFIGPGNDLGVPIPMSKAKDHMFGLVLVNDWSARDIQRWEAVPLGPFNAKNWATSISPWIVPTSALTPFEVPGIDRHPAPLHYFANDSSTHPVVYDIALQASLSVGDNGGPIEVTRTSMASLYWSFPEMIVHHTAGGCNLRPGDLLATGTLSVQGDKGQGCLLELSWGGTQEVVLCNSPEKISRTFLEDGDAVTLSGFCQGKGYRVGFGECRGRLLPASPTVGKSG